MGPRREHILGRGKDVDNGAEKQGVVCVGGEESSIWGAVQGEAGQAGRSQTMKSLLG